jgi:malonyl-CoA O-methyltransferase
MDKQAVAECFSQAAVQYDQFAHLQRTVADRLLQRIKTLSIPHDSRIVDLGTGTGYCLPALDARFEPRELLALDISPAMLVQAERRLPGVTTLQADLEDAPFEPASLHLASSSLAVQWLDEPEPFVTRISKALAPGGYLALSTLGPKTLWELKQAWASVDSQTHVNRFHHAVDWIEAIWLSDLKLELWREERLEVRYDSPMELLRELKAIGANHVDRQERPRGTGLKRMLRTYEGFKRSDDRYPATWDVFYLIARKP